MVCRAKFARDREGNFPNPLNGLWQFALPQPYPQAVSRVYDDFLILRFCDTHRFQGVTTMSSMPRVVFERLRDARREFVERGCALSPWDRTLRPCYVASIEHRC
jgi:hypothetical protein